MLSANQKSPSIWRVLLLALVNAIIVGLSFAFNRMALTVGPPEQVLAHRFTFAYAAIALYRVFRPASVSLSRRDWLRLLPLGVLYPLMFFLLQSYGLRRATASLAGILHATTPIFTVIFAMLILRESVSNKQVVGIVVTVIGLLTLQVVNLLSGVSFTLAGMLLLIGSVIALSLYTVLSRHIVQRYPWDSVAYAVIVIGTLTFNGIYLWHVGVSHYFNALNQLPYLFSVAYLGVLSSFLTSFISMYIITQLTAVQVSVFGGLSTIVAIMAGVIVLQEDLHVQHVVGALLILLGVYLVNHTQMR